MKCIYCGSTLTAKDYCPGCGADVTLLKRIVRISNLLYNKGLDKAQVRDMSGAISCLKQALKFNKENIDARNLLGLCYFETGEVVTALVEWVVSKNLKSQNNLADEYISLLQGSKNRLDTYNTAIRKYNQSLEYCRMDHEDMALMQLKKVVSRNPRFVRAYQLLALLYMKDHEWEKARRLLKKAARIDNTNTTTLRYLTAIEEETGRTSMFSRKKKPVTETIVEESPREKVIRYVSGNETIIAPATFRDSSTIATFINIMLGILLGAAIVWFLTVPAVRQSANDKANEQVSSANTSLATITATVQDLEDQVTAANENTDQAKAEVESANSQVESYNDLLEVADLYVQGDQTKTVEALGKLNADDYDGNAKSLYDDLTASVGDALFTQYYTAGTSAYVAGNYEEAATQLQAAIDSDEAGESNYYYDALYYLGFAYYNAGNTDKANEVFRQLIQKYPESESIVSPYMSTASSAGTDTSQSQGAASMTADGTADASASADTGTSAGTAASTDTTAVTDTTAQTSSGQSDITVYGNSSGTSTSDTSAQVAWTDPTTGQNYDMYGNPIYQ